MATSCVSSCPVAYLGEAYIYSHLGHAVSDVRIHSPPRRGVVRPRWRHRSPRKRGAETTEEHFPHRDWTKDMSRGRWPGKADSLVPAAAATSCIIVVTAVFCRRATEVTGQKGGEHTSSNTGFTHSLVVSKKIMVAVITTGIRRKTLLPKLSCKSLFDYISFKARTVTDVFIDTPHINDITLHFMTTKWEQRKRPKYHSFLHTVG